MQVAAMKQDDRARIDELCRAASMDVPEAYDGITVARLGDASEVVGFVRVRVIDGIAYVNPIIVDASMRGTGIGRLLMNDVMRRYDDVRLVARGESAAFYTRLGFHPVAWSAIAERIADDCPTCSRASSCEPLPMAWHIDEERSSAMKRTKIVCTMGPAVDDEAMLKSMIDAGMDVARFNFSHGTYEEHRERMDRLKKVRETLHAPTAIMLDTKGPEIRTGMLAGGEPVQLQAGAQITLTERAVEGTAQMVQQSHEGLAANVHAGTVILIDDGLIELRVERIEGSDIICTIENAGELGQRKSMNLPGTAVDLPSLTPKDEADLLFGIEQGIDFVAASFIRSSKDVRAIKGFLRENGGADISVVSKIENRQGVDNIDEIVAASDAIMVARGDLGVEVDASRVPHLQKRIIERCNYTHTPVITATQMLDSMIRNPRPTRAEVADVANAIYDGTDAIMLSGETAMGKYPLEAVRMMAQIARQSEPYLRSGGPERRDYPTDVQRVSPMVGQAAVGTAEAIHAACIVIPTTSGRTARLISNLRPTAPIYAVTQQARVMRRMQLYWGVVPMLGHVEGSSMRTTIAAARKAVVTRGLVKDGDLVVLTAGDPDTSPMVPQPAGAPAQSAPTNVMYVMQIRDEA